MAGNTRIPADARISGQHPDGWVVHTAGGARFEIRRGGSTVDLPVIRSVGLIDMCEVVSHQTNRLLGSTSHVIRLCNGGHVHFACNDRGQVLMLEGLACRLKIDSDGHVLVGAYIEHAA
jgi:hypothetical protein